MGVLEGDDGGLHSHPWMFGCSWRQRWRTAGVTIREDVAEGRHGHPWMRSMRMAGVDIRVGKVIFR